MRHIGDCYSTTHRVSNRFKLYLHVLPFYDFFSIDVTCVLTTLSHYFAFEYLADRNTLKNRYAIAEIAAVAGDLKTIIGKS